MDIIYKLHLPKEVCSKIIIFACKTQHTGLGVAVLKKKLKLKNLKIPENDRDVTCINKYEITKFPRDISIDLFFYTCFYNLTVINLNNTCVTGDIAHLKSLPKLTDIRLFNTGVTGDIAHLKSLLKLTVISLGGTGVTRNIVHLKSLPNLTQIYLGGMGVTGDMKEFLDYRESAGLPYCKIIF